MMPPLPRWLALLRFMPFVTLAAVSLALLVTDGNPLG